MTALARGRMTEKLGASAICDAYEPKIGTGVKVYAGAIIVINSAGYAVPATSAATHKCCLGVADKEYDLSTSNGQFRIKVKPGIYKVVNGSGDPVAIADIGSTVYLLDDQTIGKTNPGGNTLSAAGKMVDLDADGGVWVQMGII